MAEKPSLQQILEVYYALRASGVQRFPKPLAPRSSSAQSQASNSIAKPHCLFLIDFITSSQTLETEKIDMPPILRRLLERLPWRDSVSVHTIFDAQPKSPQLHPVAPPTIASTRAVLEAPTLGRVVCFGWRSAQVCSVALGIPFEIPCESFEAIACQVEGLGDFEILVLPDVREIEAFPEWRARIWESLLAFAPAR